MQPIDAHIHIVGNGRSGSGCWVRLAGFRRTLAAFMLHGLGLPRDLDGPDFDDVYAARLRGLVETSSIASAVILAQEEVYDEAGARMDFGSFHVPNRYVLDLARRHSEFLPCVSIHPARADALEELEHCLAEGAVMLKLLPNCHNVDPENPRYTRFWERMAEARLPLLAHTGGETTVPALHPEYADPRRLARVLEIGVTVIAAHCGTRSGLTDPDYFAHFAAMLRRFPNLYGDNSAFNLPMRGEHTLETIREPIASRMIYGSDLPVPVSGIWSWLRGFIDWRTYRRCEKIRNPLERDYQLKRAVGFPEDTFTRVHSMLRR